MLYMIPGKIRTVFADVRNVINKDVDDYFKILLRFENGVTAKVELGAYFLQDREKWFERHWFVGGNTGSAYPDGFDPTGKIVRTARLLQNVGGARTMTAAGPIRSFGPPAPGIIVTESLCRKYIQSSRHHNIYINTAKKGVLHHDERGDRTPLCI